MSIIRLSGKLTPQKVCSFKDSVSDLKTILEKELHLRIKSDGGNLKVFSDISKILFDISKKRIRVIGEAETAGSTAMLIFLNCTDRLVTPASYGYIHLPEPNTKVSEELHEKKKNDVVAFIKRRTHLSEETIISLDNIPLTANDMLRYHIATQKVPNFYSTEL